MALVKQCQFWGHTESGVFCQPLFGSYGVFEKVAGAPAFADWATGDQIREFIEKITPEERQKNAYVLLNALGAGEFFGSNINADYFPWEALSHEGRDYGYQTFLDSHAFQHHVNKDPTRAFGRPVLSLLNPQMKRVELITAIDREKAKAENASTLVEKIDRGEFPDVSMGCRVPFDVCFPAGTLVRTHDGYKPIEDIQEGSLVRTHLGNEGRVLRTMRRTADDLLKVAAAGMPTISATKNHPFLVLNRDVVRSCQGNVNGRPTRHRPDKDGRCQRCRKDLSDWSLQWSAAEDLKVGDYLVTPVDQLASATSNMAMARLLGYYIGDGHIIRQRTGKLKNGEYRDMGFSITVCKDDEEHLQRLLSTLSEAGLANEPRIYESGCGRNAVVVNVYDQDAAKTLDLFAGRTSEGKRILEDVFLWSREDKLNLIGGYIDTDGHCDDRGNVRISTINRGLALDTQRILLSLGIPASVTHGGSVPVSGLPFYNVFIPASCAKILTSYSVKVKPVETGWSSTQSFFWSGYWCTPIKMLSDLKALSEVDGEVEVFNLSVEGNESYIVEGLAVHNCSICGNKSKTPHDYCQHMRPPPELRGEFGPNKILPDGRKIYVINTLPRFFDISFVFIGADKTAKVMAKLASKGTQVCLGNVCAVPRSSVEVASLVDPGSEEVSVGQEKTASVEEECLCVKDCCDPKLASAFGVKTAEEKLSEIVKEIPASQFAMHKLLPMANSEPDIPPAKMESLLSAPVGAAAGTLGGLGIVLKPREFQTIVLIKMGERKLAEKLAAANQVFRFVPEVDRTIDLQFDPKLAHEMVDLIPDRSAFGEPFVRRSIGLTKTARAFRPAPSTIQDPMLDKVSAAYNGYRQNLLTKISQAEKAIEDDPELRQVLYGRTLADVFSKTASVQFVSLDSMAYLAGAHLPENLLGTKAVAEEVAADPWMMRHLSSQEP